MAAESLRGTGGGWIAQPLRGVSPHAEHVHRLVHGSDVDVVGLLILGVNVLHRERQAAAPESAAQRQPLVPSESVLRPAHHARHGRVVVYIGDSVSGSVPVNVSIPAPAHN
jgi:hypothetical protein